MILQIHPSTFQILRRNSYTSIGSSTGIPPPYIYNLFVSFQIHICSFLVDILGSTARKCGIIMYRRYFFIHHNTTRVAGSFNQNRNVCVGCYGPPIIVDNQNSSRSLPVLVNFLDDAYHITYRRPS